MSTLTNWLDRRLYPALHDHWDDDRFRCEIVPFLHPGIRVLDLGAGAGLVRQMNFRGRQWQIFGIDLDPRIGANPNLDGACRGNCETLPYAEGSFDLVFSDNVLEHLTRPQVVFREVARVLKPSGYFLVKTPNRHHYVTWLARLTPTRFHQWINAIRGRDETDTFPTVYAANSRSSLTALGSTAGFEVHKLTLVEGRPEYCRINPLLYLAGAAYERVVNASPAFARFRLVLIGVLRKRPVEARVATAA